MTATSKKNLSKRKAGLGTKAEISTAAPKKVARLLRERILKRKDGAFLGSEDQLLAEFDVSRPTLRQAARVLEHEQLLDVKRGLRGGYYGRRPSIDALGRAAASFLITHDTSLQDLLIAAGAASMTMVRLAALSHDAAARAALTAQLERLETLDHESASAQEFLEIETELSASIAKLSGNAPLELFVAILYRFGLDDTRHHIFTDRPDRMSQWREIRVNLTRAILEGDGEIAALHSKRLNEAMRAWIGEDDASPAPAKKRARRAATRA